MSIRHTIVLAVILSLGLTACSREATPAADAELPTLDITTWTDKTELFMEYPPLVAGETALFAVHLTNLRDFSAMNSGRTRLEFTPDAGGPPVVVQGQGPSRPGVYRVEGPMPPAGRYRWALVIESPELTDRHDLGHETVFAEEEAAVADAEARPASDASAITYLKEPQWTNGFGTVVVSEQELRRGIRAPAVIEPLTGGEAIVSAPAAGRYISASLPSIGDRIASGAVLGRIQPRLAEGGADRASLAAVVAEAETGLEAARAEQVRAQRLVDERALPARRADEAQRGVKVAEARLAAAEARLAQRDEALRTGGGEASGNAFVLRAPIAGRVVEVNAALGAAYEEGAPLFRIVRTDQVELQVHVPVSEAPLPQPITEAAFEVSGRPDPIVLVPHHMHDPGVIDPRTRALPVQFSVHNPNGQLLIGQTGTAVLYAGDRVTMPAVPKEAVLMEAGRPYVFVQLGGESFARRFIEIATRDGDVVGIRSGVKPGERVVTRNAYDVQLASAAGGLPAEGHVH